MTATPYLLPADIISDPTLGRLSTVDPDVLAGYVSQFEEVAEAFLDVAFTPRDATYSATTLRRWRGFALPHVQIRSVTTFTVNGDAFLDDLYYLDAGSGRIRFRRGYYLCGGDDVTVTYSHGYDEPPARLIQACKRFVANEASSDATGKSRNVISEAVDGSYIRYGTPDWSAGRPTGWMNVDVVLDGLRNSRPVLVG